jgi:cation-transporting ATPase E
VLLFTIPFTRHFFKLDPSNMGLTAAAFICGAVGIVLVEAAWWIAAAARGEKHTLLPSSPGGGA